MMRLLGSLLFFIFGAVAGAIIGMVIASMLTPQSGDELKVRIRERIDEGRRARAQAEVEEAERLTRYFRRKVGDPDALNES
jgi:gas vesicle protein